MLATSTNRQVSNGNGVTAAFSFPYYFLSNSDLMVYVGGVLKTLGTHYNISGAGSEAGGTVTFTAGNIPTTGTNNVVIVREPPFTQQTDYPSNDRFPSAAHERALDKLTMLVQRLKDLIDRSFTLADSDSITASLTLPSPVANRVLGWKADNSGLENKTLTAAGAVTLFMESLLDDPDAATAIDTISDGALILSGGIISAFGGITTTPNGGIGSIRVFGSDSNYATGGGRASLDVSGTTARVGYIHGGGSAGSTAIFSGNSNITAWANTQNRWITGGATAPIWDEMSSVQDVNNSDVVMLGLYNSRASYTSSVIRAQTETVAGTGWNLLDLRVAGGAEVFKVRGDGAAYENGKRVYSGHSKVTSPATAFSAVNTAYTFAHGLGAKPEDWDVYLRCTTADNGYAIGDEMKVASHSTNSACVTAWADATNIGISVAGSISTASKAGAAYAALTLGRWEFFVKYQPL